MKSKNRHVCVQSLPLFGLTQIAPVIFCEKTDRTLLLEKLRQAEKCLVF